MLGDMGIVSDFGAVSDFGLGTWAAVVFAAGVAGVFGVGATVKLSVFGFGFSPTVKLSDLVRSGCCIELAVAALKIVIANAVTTPVVMAKELAMNAIIAMSLSKILLRNQFPKRNGNELLLDKAVTDGTPGLLKKALSLKQGSAQSS